MRHFALVVLLGLSAAHAWADDVIEIRPDKKLNSISPYVYGLNAQKTDPSLGVTVRRMGGNRLTGYNWVTNASSAGSDWKHSNDDWLCHELGYKNSTEPGALATNFVRENRQLKVDTILTIPLVDYVAGDKKGDVPESEKAPSKRFVQSYLTKKTPYTLTPNPSDPVYQDEYVNFIVTKLKKAEEGGVRFYNLDNEPALWPSTHPRIHAQKTTYKELVERTEALAVGITRLDPGAQILGPVLFGWSAFENLQSAPDAKEPQPKFPTFIDYYLAQMKLLEQRHQRRLLHVLDVHWYPEAKGGGKRITDNDNSPATVAARLQAPRSLWDPTYVEDSWITQWSTNKKPIQLIGRLKEKIAKHYPGTRLAFTEYDYGAGNHVSGGLAQADVLGILGREGVYLACYWGDLKPYNAAAYKLYRNCDGKGAAFGDTAVLAQGADPAKCSVYAATDSKKPGRLTVVMLNKNLKDRLKGTIKIAGDQSYRAAKAYGFDAESAELRSRPGVELKENRFEYNLPPLSATIFVLGP